MLLPESWAFCSKKLTISETGGRGGGGWRESGQCYALAFALPRFTRETPKESLLAVWSLRGETADWKSTMSCHACAWSDDKKAFITYTWKFWCSKWMMILHVSWSVKREHEFQLTRGPTINHEDLYTTQANHKCFTRTLIGYLTFGFNLLRVCLNRVHSKSL